MSTSSVWLQQSNATSNNLILLQHIQYTRQCIYAINDCFFPIQGELI